jgi:hypothetical protein
MNNENPNLPSQVPTSDLMPCRLAYHQFIATVYVNRKQIFKMRPETLLGVYIGLDLENQKLLQCPPFLAFQMRITSDFEVEQMGDGFPCRNEARANEIIKIIEAKNVPVPRVVLANWPGYFGLVTVTNFDAWYDELVLFHYHQPKKLGEQLSKFSLRHYRRCLGKAAEMVKEEMLPTTDPQIAQQLFKEKHNELIKEEAKKQNQSTEKSNSTQWTAELMESEFLVLSKAFPETIHLMRKADISTKQEVYDAFRRDMFALTGNFEDSLLVSQQQFEELTKRRRKNRRNKQAGIDPIEFELVAGWFLKGYANMTPEKRRDALQKLGLNPPSSGALNKICLRLKLPRIRKPGKH